MGLHISKKLEVMETKLHSKSIKTLVSTAILPAVLLAANVTSAHAESEVETTIGADIVSQYIWRGTDCGGISIQPSLGVEYKGLSLGAWGSWDGKGTKEVDLTLGYSVGPLSISVTDYWFDAGATEELDDDGELLETIEIPYFNYKDKETAHVFEGTVSADLGIIGVSWSTCFAGCDYKADGKRAYSSYAEVSAPFTVGGIDWSAAIGASVSESAMYGTDKFKIINVSLGATKEIKITDSFSLPISASLIANPNTDKLYFVASISF